MNAPTPAHVLRFGVFELDTDSGELRRHGLKIRLPDQSFQILKELLSRPGEVVTREELRRVLWTTDTFVEFEVGLNSAVRKLREALDDSADNPRFVETVPRRGYRFIAPVSVPAVELVRVQVQPSPAAAPSGDRSMNNLPQQLTRFVGRKREMADIRDLWTHTRVVTLTGPGGIGKTRLALQIAVDSLPAYADGVWFVELASLADPGLVPQSVAATFGIRDEGSRSIGDTLAAYLADRHLLLVLDNCEHLIGAAAQLTDMLLRRAKDLHVLTTSREALAIAGEAVFRVSSLGLPDPAQLPDLETLSRHEAVELFLDRARSAKSTFTINQQCGSFARQPVRAARGHPARDRIGRVARHGTVGCADRCAIARSIESADGRQSNSIATPSDTTRRNRVELRAVERTGETSLPSPVRVCRRLDARSGRSRVCRRWPGQ